MTPPAPDSTSNPDPDPDSTPGTPEPVARQQRVAVYGICEDGARKAGKAGEGSGEEGSGGEDPQVLLVRAAPHLTVAGQWFLPGGGLDHGEEPEAGLRREFQEETGLDITLGPLLGIISDVFTLPDGASLHSLRIIYAVDGYSGQLRDEVGGSSDTARWVPLHQALGLPLRPYVLRALTELRG